MKKIDGGKSKMSRLGLKDEITRMKMGKADQIMNSASTTILKV